MTRRLVFTVDLDRDVNFHRDGEIAAGSMDRGQGTGPRFSSSEKGLQLLLELLDDLGIRGTFFVEGRTAETIDCSGIRGHCVGFHGYDHEDLTEVDSVYGILKKGFDTVKDCISEPSCFRAPYMKIDGRVYGALGELGIGHDSSVYGAPGALPYTVSGIIEHPVAKGKDRNGKTIAAYLWPMHEGKRGPEDYLDLAASFDKGDLVLSTHSWHMVERRDEGAMSANLISENLIRTRTVLEGILDMGFEPKVLTEAL